MTNPFPGDPWWDAHAAREEEFRLARARPDPPEPFGSGFSEAAFLVLFAAAWIGFFLVLCGAFL